MRVLLVGAELEENLALRYLAAVLERAGHEPELAPFSSPDDTPKVLAALRRQQSELVGLSLAFQRRAHELGTLAETLRAAGFGGHITCGGHFPTFAFAELLDRYPAIDTVVRHEGELTLPELCDAVAHDGGDPEQLGSIDGLAYRLHDGTVRATAARPLVRDLDELPHPKRVGEPQVHLGIPAAFLVGSRGCYGHCTFCCINAYIRDAGGPKYRRRSAASVADEIAELRRSRGARMLVFHDDDFFTRDRRRDLDRVTALRAELGRRGVDDVAIVVKARPDDLDGEIFDVLQQIGLLRVYIGIEAGCSQGLKTLGRGVDMAANHRALSFLRQRDVYACFNMLIFDPDSTIASLRSSLSFLRANPDVPMNFCRTEIYVGTPLMHRLAREGRLRGDVFGWDYDISEPAAQRAFTLFAQAFHDRNFRCDGLMNSNLGLGYHLHLLRHFYPRAVTPGLEQLADEVIRAVNLDCVAFMTEAVDFAASERSRGRQAYQDFAGRLSERVAASGALLEERVAEASRALTVAAEGRRIQPTPMWRSVAAATLALSPLACDPPMPPDPLPPPKTAEPDGGFAQPPPDPPPPPTIPYPTDPAPPPDPVPPPTATVPYPPPDPPPPPTRTVPHPPDPLPPPTVPLPADPPPPPPPPDPLPPPKRNP